MGKAARWVTAVVLAVSSWAASAVPAAAKTAIRVTAHVAPATAYIGSTVVVSGTATPAGAVEVDRLVGKVWQPLLHAKTAKSGAYSIRVKVPRTAGVWALRVVRGTAAGRVNVAVSKTAYKVSAKPAATIVNNGRPIVVTGTVSAKGKGAVWLQRLVAGKWHNVSQVKLTSHATYRLTSGQAPGSYRLRIYKPYTRTVAGGVSPAMTVVVLRSPAIVTASLPAGTVGRAYTATLAATSGLPPYTWSVAAGALPAGLTLSAAGALAGVPTLAGTSSVTFLATDSHGQAVSQVIAITMAPAYGPLWAWGFGSTGALGNGAMVNSSNIVPVSSLTKAIAISAGAGAGYAVLSDHTLWAWGYNADGELGDGLTTTTNVPHQVPGLTQVVSVAGGYLEAYALRSDGTVWAWGRNLEGQLGDGTNTNRLSPVQVGGLSGVTAIAASGLTGYALRSDGTVWAWGSNGNGQLGNGVTTNSNVPVRVGGVSGAIGIAAGLADGYALLDTGKVMAWGNNVNGELGNNSAVASSTSAVPVSGITEIVGIAGGWSSAYALRADGSVWAWGAGSMGQLGNGGTALSKVPVQVTGLTGAISIAGGTNSGYAVLADGTVRAWGDNAYGGLGNGSTTMSPVPVQVSGLTGVTRMSAGLGWAMALQPG
ncbi:MAG: hypothetical protein QOI76_1117 [Frankiales bacterium]|nr:hypothetical protein [Frankiales bacterium]